MFWPHDSFHRLCRREFLYKTCNMCTSKFQVFPPSLYDITCGSILQQLLVSHFGTQATQETVRQVSGTHLSQGNSLSSASCLYTRTASPSATAASSRTE